MPPMRRRVCQLIADIGSTIQNMAPLHRRSAATLVDTAFDSRSAAIGVCGGNRAVEGRDEGRSRNWMAVSTLYDIRGNYGDLIWPLMDGVSQM